MVDDSDGLLREVQEELRREQLAKLWERYGTYAIAGAAVIVACVAGYKFWQSQQAAFAQTTGAKYEQALAALSNGKTDDAVTALQDVASGGHKGYRPLAELQLAGVLIKEGKAEEAKSKLDDVAASSEVGAMLREFATLQSVALNVGEADFTDVKNRLNPLASEGSPWRTHALEMIGTAAFDAGRYEDARQALRALLADPSVAPGTAERANMLLSRIAASEMAAKALAKPVDAAGAEDAEKASSETKSGATPQEDSSKE